MRLSRLFVETPLVVGQSLTLSQEGSHYLLNVLRLPVGASLTLFNGQGGQYSAQITAYTKKSAHISVRHYEPIERESILQLGLVQAISRPEHMDYSVQKSVELGVQHIIPIITERSPPLDKATFTKRYQHWKKIVISACEQCGRNQLPILQEPEPFSHWIKQAQEGLCIVLSPEAKHTLAQVLIPNYPVTVLNGPEGGLTQEELQQTIQAGYVDTHLGPRIMRTETAITAMLSACQAIVGDWQNKWK